MSFNYASNAINDLIERGLPVAQKEAILANMPLVASVARKYKRCIGMTFSDLIHEGVIGLINAIEKFNWRRGIRFCTYATWQIRKTIGRAVYHASKTTVSIDCLIGKNEVALAEFIRDRDCQGIVTSDIRDTVWRSLQKLTWREQVVIVLRVGMLDEKPRTFKEIGALTKIRGSNAHRIYRRALQKLSQDQRLQEL